MKKIVAFLLMITLLLSTECIFANEISAQIVDTEEVDGSENLTEEANENYQTFDETNGEEDNSNINTEANENYVSNDKISTTNDIDVYENTELSDQEQKDEEYLKVKYSTHVQKIGWQADCNDGVAAGTTGKSLRIEAIKISLDNSTSYSGNIIYSTHVQDIGWQQEKNSGEISGTTGKALRVEAIKIKLTGDIADHYDVYYRTHIAKIGWMPWTKNGNISGSVGLSLQMEAIEIKVLSKDADDTEKPDISSNRSYVQGVSDEKLIYSTHVQKLGNTKWVSGGNVTGTTGRKLRIEGINIRLSQNEQTALTGTIMYRTHIQNIGWTAWRSAGEYSGTGGQSKRVEAIEIKLTGQLASFYNIYYSAHIENYGWLGWASNGQTAGSTGIRYRMEALKIRIIRKGAGTPGTTSNYYKNKPVYTPKPAALDAMSQNAQGRASSTKWLIMTDTSACQVGVYSGSYGNWKRVALWSCGPGKPSTPTVKGEFTIYGRGKSFGSKTYTCWYYTQFYGNYLFHSVLYNHGSMTQIQDGTLGKQVSHGCVRLDINNAKWLYDNIPNGTKVVIY